VNSDLPVVDVVHEFWPEPYEAPANRAHLVERM